jgi:hypothetical protein
MTELKKLAETVRTALKLEYDVASVKFMEGFIERNKLEIPEAEWDGLINSCGAFLGQCVIENYGGEWKRDEDGHTGVSFDDRNWVFPFAKVSKQFENGLGDSIYSFYTLIPVVFKVKLKARKKWWQFW